MYRTIDLCAGIGGIRKGFEMTGRFENVLASEIDKNAIKTYKHLYGQDADHDLTDASFKALVSETPYDVLLAGFPCQTFSSAGLKQGFDDETKGNIFFHLCEIIEATRPKAVFFENVSNLISHNKGATFRTIISWLEDHLNYKVIGVERFCDNTKKPFDSKKFIRNTKNFGLPQNRSRTYIVAFDRMRYWDKLISIDDELPTGNQLQIYENNDVRNLIEFGAEASYYLSEKYLETLERHILTQHEKGNGFGYCILNDPEHPHTISNTILATKPVHLDITQSFIHRDDFPDFFDGLREAVENSITYWRANPNGTSEVISFIEGVKRNLDAELIPVLVCSDYNTTGLNGVNASDDEQSIWKLLVDTEGISIKNDENSAGSYGIGKNAPFAYSNLNLVLYNTFAEDGGRAFEGVARLVTTRRL